MSPAQHRIFCWSLFFLFSPVSLIKPSLDQPGGSSSGFVPQQHGGLSSGFVCKQPGGFLGFCLQAAWRVSSGFFQLCCYCLVAPLRPATAAPSSLEVFLRFCSPAAWRLILGFCLQAARRFPRVLFASSLQGFLGFPSSLEDFLGFCFPAAWRLILGFCCKQPGGFLGFCLQAAWRIFSGFVSPTHKVRTPPSLLC